MQIVIDIPEEEYKKILKMHPAYPNGVFCLTKAIQNGTPLPKGHGRLIDGTCLYNDLVELEDLAFSRANDTPSTIFDKPNPAYIRYNAQLNERTELKHKVFDAPTIVEADKTK